MTRQYFNLLSTGRTATHWIANAISLHPRAFCAHGPDLEPFRSDETEKQRTSRHHRDSAKVAAMTLDDYFDLLETRDFDVYGLIHGIGVDPAQLPNFRRRYFVAAVTREPIVRLRSFIARWQYEAEALPEWHEQTGPWLAGHYASCVQAGMTMPPQDQLSFTDLLFIGAAWWMTVNDPLHNRGVPIFRCEDLGDRQGFAKLFTAITQGRLEADADYLDAVMALPRQDQRALGPDSARAEFASWTSWQQKLLGDLLDLFRLRPAYRDLNYDMNF
ncbi:MAG: hypothetical protein H7Y60_13590 [Rhodospirillaceae bacterium]|nr:hypothetical protein [Rhodospirillales bacterium]